MYEMCFLQCKLGCGSYNGSLIVNIFSIKLMSSCNNIKTLYDNQLVNLIAKILCTIWYMYIFSSEHVLMHKFRVKEILCQIFDNFLDIRFTLSALGSPYYTRKNVTGWIVIVALTMTFVRPIYKLA